MNTYFSDLNEKKYSLIKTAIRSTPNRHQYVTGHEAKEKRKVLETQRRTVKSLEEKRIIEAIINGHQEIFQPRGKKRKKNQSPSICHLDGHY